MTEKIINKIVFFFYFIARNSQRRAFGSLTPLKSSLKTDTVLNYSLTLLKPFHGFPTQRQSNCCERRGEQRTHVADKSTATAPLYLCLGLNEFKSPWRHV